MTGQQPAIPLSTALVELEFYCHLVLSGPRGGILGLSHKGGPAVARVT